MLSLPLSLLMLLSGKRKEKLKAQKERKLPLGFCILRLLGNHTCVRWCVCVCNGSDHLHPLLLLLPILLDITLYVNIYLFFLFKVLLMSFSMKYLLFLLTLKTTKMRNNVCCEKGNRVPTLPAKVGKLNMSYLKEMTSTLWLADFKIPRWCRSSDRTPDL